MYMNVGSSNFSFEFCQNVDPNTYHNSYKGNNHLTPARPNKKIINIRSREMLCCTKTGRPYKRYFLPASLESLSLERMEHWRSPRAAPTGVSTGIPYHTSRVDPTTAQGSTTSGSRVRGNSRVSRLKRDIIRLIKGGRVKDKGLIKSGFHGPHRAAHKRG